MVEKTQTILLSAFGFTVIKALLIADEHEASINKLSL